MTTASTRTYVGFSIQKGIKADKLGAFTLNFTSQSCFLKDDSVQLQQKIGFKGNNQWLNQVLVSVVLNEQSCTFINGATHSPGGGLGGMEVVQST